MVSIALLQSGEWKKSRSRDTELGTELTICDMLYPIIRKLMTEVQLDFGTRYVPKGLFS